MKKIIYFVVFLTLSVTLFSCKKDDAVKDVEISISKLEQFNTKFAELYSDNQISSDTLEGQKMSEYDALKKLATEYYEAINKINSSVEAEKTALAEGDEIDGYEEAYKAALETNKDKINQATKLFEENIYKMQGLEKTCTNDIVINIEEVQKHQILSIRKTIELENIGQEMGIMYGEIYSFAGKNNLKFSGVPIAIYHVWSDSINDVECGIPFEGTATSTDKIKVSETFAGKVVTTVHFGSYDKMYDSWTALDQYILDNKLEICAAPWEEYITDPMAEKDTIKWQTKIYQPIK